MNVLNTFRVCPFIGGNERTPPLRPTLFKVVMKLFLDTADATVLQWRWATGLLDGVKINHREAFNAGREFSNVYKEFKLMGIPIFTMDPHVYTTLALVTKGHELNENFGDWGVVEVPCTRGGLMACKELRRDHIKVNVTQVNTAAQAILAAKANASYVSINVGALDENSIAGLEVVRSVTETYARNGVRETEVISEGIRDVYKVTRSFYNGADIVVVTPEVFNGMFNHVLTHFTRDIDGDRLMDTHPIDY